MTRHRHLSPRKDELHYFKRKDKTKSAPEEQVKKLTAAPSTFAVRHKIIDAPIEGSTCAEPPLEAPPKHVHRRVSVKGSGYAQEQPRNLYSSKPVLVPKQMNLSHVEEFVEKELDLLLKTTDGKPENLLPMYTKAFDMVISCMSHSRPLLEAIQKAYQNQIDSLLTEVSAGEVASLKTKLQKIENDLQSEMFDMKRDYERQIRDLKATLEEREETIDELNRAKIVLDEDNQELHSELGGVVELITEHNATNKYLFHYLRKEDKLQDESKKAEGLAIKPRDRRKSISVGPPQSEVAEGEGEEDNLQWQSRRIDHVFHLQKSKWAEFSSRRTQAKMKSLEVEDMMRSAERSERDSAIEKSNRLEFENRRLCDQLNESSVNCSKLLEENTQLVDANHFLVTSHEDLTKKINAILRKLADVVGNHHVFAEVRKKGEDFQSVVDEAEGSVEQYKAEKFHVFDFGTPTVVFQQQDKVQYFLGRGQGVNIPEYLRSNGKVRGPLLSYRDIKIFLHDFWTFKKGLDSNKMSRGRHDIHQALSQYVAIHQPTVSRLGWSYSMLSALSQYRHDSRCRLFRLILDGVMSEKQWWDVENHVKALRDALVRQDTTDNNTEIPMGVLRKKSVIEVVKILNPSKAFADLSDLRTALDKFSATPEVQYIKLFEQDALFCQALFIELYRDQYVFEIEEYLQKVETLLNNMSNQEGEISTKEIRDAIKEIDPERSSEEIQEIMSWGLGQTGSRLNIDMAVKTSDFLKRLKGRGLVKRSSRANIMNVRPSRLRIDSREGTPNTP